MIAAHYYLRGNLQLNIIRCGTPGFVAPEILDYCDEMPLYNQKCDIFSAGIILYVLIVYIY